MFNAYKVLFSFSVFPLPQADISTNLNENNCIIFQKILILLNLAEEQERKTRHLLPIYSRGQIPTNSWDRPIKSWKDVNKFCLMSYDRRDVETFKARIRTSFCITVFKFFKVRLNGLAETFATHVQFAAGVCKNLVRRGALLKLCRGGGWRQWTWHCFASLQVLLHIVCFDHFCRYEQNKYSNFKCKSGHVLYMLLIRREWCV